MPRPCSTSELPARCAICSEPIASVDGVAKIGEQIVHGRCYLALMEGAEAVPSPEPARSGSRLARLRRAARRLFLGGQSAPELEPSRSNRIADSERGDVSGAGHAVTDVAVVCAICGKPVEQRRAIAGSGRSFAHARCYVNTLQPTAASDIEKGEGSGSAVSAEK